MANAQAEPSMEEILASIRRIISEDEDEPAPRSAGPTPSVTPKAATPVKAPEPVTAAISPAPAAADLAAEENDEPTSDEASYGSSDDDGAESHLATEDVEMIKQNVAAAIQDEDDAIVDETAATAASQAFRSLSSSVRVTDSDGPGLTLEQIVTEMLKPMVKDWLDANLPAIVEEKVEEEVQRIARRRR
jgi:cell pole-organizing protein PopZ